MRYMEEGLDDFLSGECGREGDRVSYDIRTMSFGEILDAGFQLLRNHARVLIGISALLNVPVALLQTVSPPASAAAGLGLVRSGVALLLLLVGGPIVATATNWAVGEVYVGRPASMGPALRAAWSVLLPLAGTVLLLYFTFGGAAGVLSLVGVGLAMFVNWVVGVIFLVLAILACIGYLLPVLLLLWPVMVLERTFGWAALRRSRELMRGCLLRGVGIALVGALIVSVPSNALQLVLGHIPVLGPLGVGLALAAGGAYTPTVMVLLYFDIRCRKEAFDLEHLARLVEATTPTHLAEEPA